VSQWPMRLLPCITRAFWRDPDEWAAISCRQSQVRLAAEFHSTSFKHALYWLMRNLLKISRGRAGVNILGPQRKYLGAHGLLVGGGESRGKSCGIPHLAKNERDAPNFLQVDETRSTCAPFLKERRMRIREPTRPHRKSGMWGTRPLWLGKD
jgi:hypothetical protein